MMRRPRPRGRIAALVLAIVAVGAGGAAWAGELPAQDSSNWAGWVVTSGSPRAQLDRRFTSVSASWVQPSAVCGSKATFAAFWVGLGGYYDSSLALEQIGTEADCSSLGEVFYYAWYEFVPAPPVTIGRLRVRPGDVITASVHVSAYTVKVALADLTTGARRFTYAHVMRHPGPDTSAAEWIAEAPSDCGPHNRCTPLLLSNFQQVTFSSARATAIGTLGRHSGPITDPIWRHYGMIVLAPSRASGPTPAAQGFAHPGALSTNGSSFSVSYGTGASASGATGATGASGATGAT